MVLSSKFKLSKLINHFPKCCNEGYVTKIKSYNLKLENNSLAKTNENHNHKNKTIERYY